MHFRCPNCEHQVDVLEHVTAHDATIDELTCPSCQSRFSLSVEEAETTITEENRSLAHFELQTKLGEGAFGSVFRAWDTKLLRAVAIKIPRKDRVTRDASRSFLREAQSAARIRHPNVVQVYEVGTLDNTFYIATEFIDGINLSDWLKQKTLTPREAAALCAEICDGVQAAHDAKIVHRDLKPGNILMDQAGHPHITDFGLARRDNPTEISVTQDGRLLGTPAYMSPEQARGENSTTRPAADIYALGVTLYELATGQRPFQASSSHTVMYRLLHEDPAPPSSLRREIPRDLETIILHAMQKDADARYKSAAAMAADLRHLLNDEPIEAQPVPAIRRAVKWVRRHRQLSASLAIILLLSIISAFALVSLMNRSAHGVLPVRVAEIPGATSLQFIPWDETTRRPLPLPAVDASHPNDTVQLTPGLYKVRAQADERSWHEVWRWIPDTADQPSLSWLFPHRTWTIDDSGTIVLPGFSLFRDSDLQEPVVLIRGGPFVAGYQEQPGTLAEKHEQQVDSLLVGIHEVSWGQFRRLLSAAGPKSTAGGKSWLELIYGLYGDRSEIPDDQPVSGYPLDVAMLYCELAGGRLPTSVEWEYTATQGGTQQFPTGDQAAVISLDDWKIVSTTESTPDTHPAGIRNLFYSLSEYTDSRMLSYAMLYPDRFSGPRVGRIDAGDLAGMQPGIEVRGAPAAWIRHQSPPATAEFNIRERASAPARGTDAMAHQTFDRIGWRLFRTASP